MLNYQLNNSFIALCYAEIFYSLYLNFKHNALIIGLIRLI